MAIKLSSNLNILMMMYNLVSYLRAEDKFRDCEISAESPDRVCLTFRHSYC